MMEKNNKLPLSYSLPWNRFRALFWGPSVLPPITPLIFFCLSTNEGSRKNNVTGERAVWVLYRKPCVLLWEGSGAIHCTAVFTLCQCASLPVLSQPHSPGLQWGLCSHATSVSQSDSNEWLQWVWPLSNELKERQEGTVFILRTRSCGVMAALHTHTGTHYIPLASFFLSWKWIIAFIPKSQSIFLDTSSRTKCQQ